MDEGTKKKALNKAKLMKDKYGFPQYILNDTRINEEYDGLKLSGGGDFWQYTWDINLWAIQKHLSKLRKPVDKELWSMSVEETNAYYSPTDNAMVFPAGIKYFFHLTSPNRYNFKEILINFLSKLVGEMTAIKAADLKVLSC